MHHYYVIMHNSAQWEHGNMGKDLLVWQHGHRQRKRAQPARREVAVA